MANSVPPPPMPTDSSTLSDQAGKTTVIKPGNSLNIISENELDGSPHMASFAPYKSSFLIRTDNTLYRVGGKVINSPED
jgi:hypothetical protein